MAKATFTLDSVEISAAGAHTLDLTLHATRTGNCNPAGTADDVAEVDLEVSIDGDTWSLVGGGQYGCQQIGTSSTSLTASNVRGGDQAFWNGGTRHARLKIPYGDASVGYSNEVAFEIPYVVLEPIPPVGTITEAWKTQKENFVSDYEAADDDSGSIANVGSPPVPKYVQTYDEAQNV
jgi:hypothetical protein